jgi:two-component system, cell cycle sensor histidine kinase and response regulator CckA
MKDETPRGRSRWTRTVDERFAAPTRTEREQSRSSGVPGGPEAILIVEDQDQVREATRTILERLGYQVDTAPSADDALRYIRDGGEVDLLITDVVLPGMNGVALAERVAAAKDGVRVLFMSAYTSEAGVPEGRVQGRPCAFLQKPFSRDVLARSVRELLDRLD